PVDCLDIRLLVVPAKAGTHIPEGGDDGVWADESDSVRRAFAADGLRYSPGQTQPARASKGRRQEIVDDREHHQKDEPGHEAKADELVLDRKQRLGRSPLKFGADIGFRHRYAPRNDQPASGGLMPLKNSQEIMRPTQITKPNRLMT